MVEAGAVEREEVFDLVIGGGGTYGPAAFLTALLSGARRVALIEKGKVGLGVGGRAANHASNRMLQPGLKYVQSDLSVVEIDALDCALLHSIAGDLLEEKKFILPVYKDYKFPLSEPWIWDIVLTIYDKYSRIALHPAHECFQRKSLLEEEPGLKGRLAGGVAFYEWVTDPVALSRLFVLAGQKLGGAVFENSEVVGFEMGQSGERRRIKAVIVRDADGGEKHLPAGCFLNACGAWAPRVARLFGANLKLRLTKGTTIIVKKRLTRHPAIVFDELGHYLTIMPWGELTSIGPTNYDVSSEVSENPDLLQPELFEIEELLRIANKFFGGGVSKSDIVETKCGLRPQLSHEGVGPYEVTHEFAVYNHREDGIENAISLVGGKLTSQLRMAKEAVEAACSCLQKEFVWKIPYVSLGQNGSLEYNNKPAVRLGAYSRRRGLKLNCGEAAEWNITKRSLIRKFQATLNIFSQTLRYFFRRSLELF